MYNNVIVRLVAYYLAVMVFISGLFRFLPVLGEYIGRERARQGGRASLELEGFAENVPLTSGGEGIAQLLDPEKSIPVLLSLLIALSLVLPVVWVYRWTRPPERYSQAFAHTLLVVPIAITLVVFLVKGSLALAFSLAGIVAAVRFRTSLDEPMDAVYIFIVIGTGLAAGVQLLAVAAIASILFNVVALAVWRTNYGREAAVLNGWRLAEGGPEGHRSASGIAEGRALPDAEDDPFNTHLRVHVTRLEDAQEPVISVLKGRAKRWQLAEVTQQQDGTSIIDFYLRIKKSTDLAAFVREIEQSDPHVSKVELTKSNLQKRKVR